MPDKILVVDDEVEIADLIEVYLNNENYSVFKFYSAKEALDCINTTNLDLAILDVMLPDIDGYTLCQKIRTRHTYPIIMLTAKDGETDKINGLTLGADDYMVKPFDFRELNARIKVLLKRVSGNVPELPQELVYADLRIDLQRKDVERNNVPIKLSPKEYNLLLYMVENAERVLSRVEIAEKVWNTHFDTGTNFIDVYINYLRKKIDRNFEPKLIHTKAGMGFILTDKL